METQARKLMSQVDEFYENEDPRASHLDAELEDLLEELEARLLAREEEGGEAEDCYDGAGVEEQFVATWWCWLEKQGMGNYTTLEEIAQHLRSILRDAIRGSFSPSDFLDTNDQTLLAVAEELYQERQSLILRIRSAAPRLSAPSGSPRTRRL